MIGGKKNRRDNNRNTNVFRPHAFLSRTPKKKTFKKNFVAFGELTYNSTPYYFDIVSFSIFILSLPPVGVSVFEVDVHLNLEFAKNIPFGLTSLKAFENLHDINL